MNWPIGQQEAIRTSCPVASSRDGEAQTGQTGRAGATRFVPKNVAQARGVRCTRVAAANPLHDRSRWATDV